MVAKPGEQSNWRTKSIPFTGGMRLDLVPVLRDSTAPGTLLDSQNFQSGTLGGYQRIYGYALWDTAIVPGGGRIQNCIPFKTGVIATNNGYLYYSTGSGWGSKLNPSNQFSTTAQVRARTYQWSTRRVVFVDSNNPALKWDGTTLTVLNGTGAPTAPTCVCEYHNALFLAQGSTLYGSAVNDETTWNAGAFTLVFGDQITGIREWRGDLYIFGQSSIGKLTGTSSANYVYTPITDDIGCNFPDTIQEVAGNVHFLAPDGVRLISGTARIGDSNLADITNPIKNYLDSQVAAYNGANDRITANVVDARTQYRLYFSRSTDNMSPGILCHLVGTNPSYYSENDTWEFFKLRGFQVSAADHGVLSDGTQLVIHGDFGGYVYKQESGNNFNGANIPAFIQTGYLFFDDPAVRKVIYKLRLYVNADSNALETLTAQVNLDDNDPTVLQPSSVVMSNNYTHTTAIYGFGGTIYGTAIYGAGAGSNYLVNPVGGGYNLAITISSNDTNPSYTIRTAIIDYAVEARQ